MKYVRRIVYSLLLMAAVNALPLVCLLYANSVIPGAGWLLLPLAAVFLWVNLRPIPKAGPTKRIRRLEEDTGCGKVNIIAHSKGGLDSRAAIAHCEMAPYVATPDVPGVVYESVMSYCKKAQHGKFPLNMTYPIVKHFDGLNDGLVSVESAKWGERFTLLEPESKRGISHGDVVDLNRENIRGFDVREFYVKLAADLKRRGY